MASIIIMEVTLIPVFCRMSMHDSLSGVGSQRQHFPEENLRMTFSMPHQPDVPGGVGDPNAFPIPMQAQAGRL